MFLIQKHLEPKFSPPEMTQKSEARNLQIYLHPFFPSCQVAVVVKNPPANAEDTKRCVFDPWVGKIPWRRKWQSTPVFMPGESHGQRSLAGYTVHGVAKSQTQLKQFSTHVAQLKLGFIILNLTFLYSDCIYFSLACEPFCKLNDNCFRVR